VGAGTAEEAIPTAGHEAAETLRRNKIAVASAKDSRIDSHDSITKFFFTDSFWPLRDPRLKLGPRVACGRSGANRLERPGQGLIGR
jgi:hypothetical protein